ncbi:MAG: response regulator transcription factor [Bacteroidales bacterium]|nr:response regulator transcription factor [Bacteroidales bacterium]
MISQASLGNILIIDSDHAISELLRLNLRTEGYAVSVIEHTADVTPASLSCIHLIIIDAADDNPSGVEFIESIKSTPRGASVGIICCSDLENERLLIDALDAGADDVVRKPFSLREMLTRVRAVLRRRCRTASSIDDASIVRFKEMTVDMVNKAVTIDGEPVGLSNTEYAILELLLRNVNTYTSRIEIFRNVWPDGTGANDRIVDTNISRLRRKLGNIGSCIVNRTGLGYMIS